MFWYLKTRRVVDVARINLQRAIKSRTANFSQIISASPASPYGSNAGGCGETEGRVWCAGAGLGFVCDFGFDLARGVAIVDLGAVTIFSSFSFSSELTVASKVRALVLELRSETADWFVGGGSFVKYESRVRIFIPFSWTFFFFADLVVTPELLDLLLALLEAGLGRELLAPFGFLLLLLDFLWFRLLTPLLASFWNGTLESSILSLIDQEICIRIFKLFWALAVFLSRVAIMPSGSIFQSILYYSAQKKKKNFLKTRIQKKKMFFCCVKILLKGLKGKKGGMKMVYNPEVTKPAFLLVFF